MTAAKALQVHATSAELAASTPYTAEEWAEARGVLGSYWSALGPTLWDLCRLGWHTPSSGAWALLDILDG